MASETLKKRQKEAAHREEQLGKVPRWMEKRNEKARSESRVEEDTPKIAPLGIRRGPTIL